MIKEINEKKVVEEPIKPKEQETKEEVKPKPKIRKLSKKLLIVPATEAVDEPQAKAVEETINKKKPKGNPQKAKKMLIIESDDEKDNL